MITAEMSKALQESGFYLGGSRRMAEKFPDKVSIAPETDWDFYCEDTIEKRIALQQCGFEEIDAPNKDYWDDLLIAIFKHPEHDIQVLFRKDVDLYRRSFESIDADIFVNQLWKSSPTRNLRLTKLQFSAMVCDYFNRLFKAHEKCEAA